jgi:hypothetical protein
VKAGKDDEAFRVMGFEWRVLRFNTVTRQSVAKVMLVAKDGDPSQLYFMQQPNCVAFEYVKSMLSVGLATVSLGGLKIEQVANGTTKMRVLCVGLGGGSLPLFLAHNLPGEPPSTAVKNGVQIVTSTLFFTLRISLVFQQYPGNQS